MSSWTDKTAIEQTLKLRDNFLIETFIETGTFKGTNAELYSKHFYQVLTCEANKEYYDIAKKKLERCDNVITVFDSSKNVLRKTKELHKNQQEQTMLFFYLDAHFYNKDAKPEDRWIVIKELQALEDFKYCIIAIHDFDCSGLGHLTYDGESLDWNVIGKYLQKVNPNFHYYCNIKEYCDIYNEETIKESSITVDDNVLDNLRYANSSDEKRYRGIIYAIPEKLDLTKYKLKEFKYE